MEKFCRQCGSELTPGVQYCTKCGAAVIQTEPPAPAPDRSDSELAASEPQVDPKVGRVIVALLLVAAIGFGVFMFTKSRSEQPGATESGQSVNGTGNSGGQDQPSSSTTPSQSASDSAINLKGNWSGTQWGDNFQSNHYDVKLKIKSQDSSGNVSGTFGGCGGSKRRCGTFAVSGKLAGTSLTLKGTHWIKQPSGWKMDVFDLDVEGDSMTGRYAFVDSPKNFIGGVDLTR